MTSPAPASLSDEHTSGYATHDVLNQPGALAGYNAYAADQPLTAAMRTFGADWAHQRLQRTGALVGSERIQLLARQANRHAPELRTHDRFGHRVDIVEFHPAYHELMALIYEGETHSFAWANPRAGAHVVRAGLSYLWNQGENGICCPILMSFGAVAALRHDPDLLAEWGPLINRPAYDPRAIPARQKAGVTIGMAMTEKQGGSDLRASITTARPATSRRGSGAPYLITGHKWFFSVPMSDLFVTLAQTDKGLSCFLATGWLPDGRRNQLKLQRLKDKCGNKSNASSEVEFYDLHAGDARRGRARHPHHHRDGASDAAGHRDRLRRADAPGPDAGDPPRDEPPRLPARAGRPADHAQRARRPRGRERGDDVADHARRACAGSLAGRSRGRPVVADLHAGCEILGVQARGRVRRRGVGMPSAATASSPIT
jgi:hypothetical protein